MADENVEQQEQQEEQQEEQVEQHEEGEEEQPSGADEKDDLPENEAKEAKNLYKLLKDPTTRNQVLKTLGEQAGLFNDIKTEKDVKEAKRGVMEILSETLGKEYEFLTPKLAQALEAILETERESYRSEVSRVEQTQINNDVQSALNKVAAETKGASRALEGKMAALAQKFPAGPDVTAEEYVRGLYAMANSDRKPTNTKQIADRINRNSKDVHSRISSTGAGKDSPRNLGKMNINQAVNYAIKSLGLDKD